MSIILKGTEVIDVFDTLSKSHLDIKTCVQVVKISVTDNKTSLLKLTMCSSRKYSYPPAPRKGLEIPAGWGGGGQRLRNFRRGGGGLTQ